MKTKNMIILLFERSREQSNSSRLPTVARRIKRQIFTYLFLFLILHPSIFAQENVEGFKFVKEAAGIQEYEYTPNGLHVLLRPDHSSKVVAVLVHYRVGSRNEYAGFRGAAHLLEHMMFKGTPKYQKSKNTAIFTLLQEIGAFINAGTWVDGIEFYETFPSEHLDLALDIEADRMRNSLIQQEDLKSEMPVVQSEFDKTENNPMRALEQAVWKEAFQIHPYHFPEIGLRRDVETVTAKQLHDFYDIFMQPDNATVVVIGDFENADALNKIAEKFGKYPRSPGVPRLQSEEPEQKGKRHVELTKQESMEAVLLAYKIPPALHEDTPALQVLAQILSAGTTSRLARKLIDGGWATGVQADVTQNHDPTLFHLVVTLTPQAKHTPTENAVYEVLDEIKKNGVTEEEFVRASNKLLVKSAFDRDGFLSEASQLSLAIAIGDWTDFAAYQEKLAKVTAEDIKRVAIKYFDPEKLTTGYLFSNNPEYLKQKESSSSMPHMTAESEPETKRPVPKKVVLSPLTAVAAEPVSESKIAERAVIQTSNGIKTITVKTGVKDVVTIEGSFDHAGNMYAENRAVPAFTAMMLDKGTRFKNKHEIARLLEDQGIELSIGLDYERVGFQAHCLKANLRLVVQLLAELLRYPEFPDEELTLLKNLKHTEILGQMSETGQQASTTLTRNIYSENHPSYIAPFEKQLQDIEKLDRQMLKEFHRTHYGPQNLIFVAVGDVEPEFVQQSVARAFHEWTPKKAISNYEKKVTINARGRAEKIPLGNNAQINVIWGHALPLTRQAPDFLAAYLGNKILGGDFQARLFSVVRNQKGLTYHIYSSVSGIEKDVEGHWQISTILNQKTLVPGIKASMKEMRKFARKGIFPDELEMKKKSIAGGYQVLLSTTGGLASEIVMNEHFGFDISRLDEYPSIIQSIPIEDVNAAIKKYYHPNRLFMIVSGNLDQKNDPKNTS